MTYSQVYEILPPTGRHGIRESEEVEDWWLGAKFTEGDYVLLQIFYRDGKVADISRNLYHRYPIEQTMMPEPIKIQN